ncbi:daunorubicin resistance protein DrrA family ABC transporter ATP-binding protein [Paractinoplanes abujensis]|uniref:Oleandomycin transport system ATP-binding protein n=1 Tax=Paractinoplanes abujensis TaxID=882441 RepID=A0A7W7CPP0_9ACTN|nr:ATP-binding cassette domain-containing protein [Actinoplanes abujensis]MBB4692431.1 oleandomycin transport system ATP-binding protein [Actinoplanes abujensis]GID24091.1 daunorubicin resistance protein DrrA family ABC transporter ATP-binding protein [Actinoplanes abujensis]
MSDLVVRAEGLRKRFGRTQALDGVDLAMRRGTVLGVLGPNGAGKTTAVRVLATLLRPDEGYAEVAGIDVLKQPARVRRRIGLTGQYASVDEDLTGTQNLVLIGRLLDLPARDARKRAAELLEWFDLAEAAGRPAKTYSGGMRRRLDLAASLVGHPEVIFLDEPTTGLDPAKREDMWGVVRDQVAQGASVLLTTQYLEEADALADEIVVVNHGRVIAHDNSDGLKRRVGGLTLRVRPADPARVPDALRILDAVAAPGTTASADTAAGARPGAVSVPVKDDLALDVVVPALRQAGVEVVDLGLHLPSLDEVFHSLTEGTPAGSTAKEGELV